MKCKYTGRTLKSPLDLPDLSKLPTEFRGVTWDAGWEFDMPTIVYYPTKYMTNGYSNNSFGIDSMVEEICYDISSGKESSDGGIDSECEWRGWSKKGFAKRKIAWHVVITGQWLFDKEGDMFFKVTDRSETFGPPNAALSGQP